MKQPSFYIAGLDDVAVMGEAVKECGSHLWVAEHARPFAEGEIGGDDDRGAFVKATDQVEQQLAAGLGEREDSRVLLEDDDVEGRSVDEVGEASLSSGSTFGLEN